MLGDLETLVGLRTVLANAVARLQQLIDALTLGVPHRDLAESANLTLDVAAMAILESDATIRKLARPAGQS